MAYIINCPDWGDLENYKSDKKEKDATVFYFRVNYYPYYIAHLVNDNRNAYPAVEKFYKQWLNTKFEGIPLDTHTKDPPSNLTALMKNAFDEYKKNPYSFSVEVKQQINNLIEIIKKWTKYKKYLRDVRDVKNDIIRFTK